MPEVDLVFPRAFVEFVDPSGHEYLADPVKREEGGTPDIVGSIRTPSGWCGIFGHKTTFGIIPGRGHIPGPPGTLADPDLGVFGPMGRSADDLDLGLDVMVGPSPEMASAWKIALPPPRRNDLKAYRMAVWLDDPAAPLDGEPRRVLTAAVDALRRAGVSVVDSRPDLDLGALVQDYFKMLYPIVLAGMPDEGFENMTRMAETLPKETGELTISALVGASTTTVIVVVAVPPSRSLTVMVTTELPTVFGCRI